ncbi:calpain-8-like isoform X2 [Liolophura sinensis]
MIVKSGNPHFVVKSSSRFDFDQGALGDCWFIAAAATLASSPQDNFRKVVPVNQSFDDGSYAGIFLFRFWSYGAWRDVVIDDYLPCNEAGLLYCRNREEPNEFWAALLEKAFAKFYGSYQRLEGGFIHYALLTLTGGITEVVDLDSTSLPSPHRLYHMLARSHAMNAFIGGAIFKPKGSGAREIKKKNGLFMGHAYSVTGFQQVMFESQTVYLLRVRNPWGKGEWRGMWSDRWLQRAHFSEEQRRLLNVKGLRHDGEFWISIEDFMENFNQIQMCHLEPDSMLSEVVSDMKQDDWKLVSYHDSWTETDPPQTGCCFSSTNLASQFPNPQFYFLVKQPTQGRSATVVISLMEKEVRQSLQPQIYINFFLYKLQSHLPERITHNIGHRVKLVGRGSKQYAFFKEISARFTLDPGCYIIVPETFRDDAEANFLLRIFSKGTVESGKI